MSYTSVSYHTLDNPLNEKKLPGLYSDLHSLYPGRPMPSSDNNNRYSIEHSSPEEAHEAFEDVKEKTKLYGDRLERKARKAGSGDKMTVHSIEDPSTIIEDPGLMNTEMLNPKDTPLLRTQEYPVDDYPERNDQTHIERESKTPLRENFKSEESDKEPSTTKGGSSYRWIVILLMIAAVIFGYYYFTKGSNVDIYEF